MAPLFDWLATLSALYAAIVWLASYIICMYHMLHGWLAILSVRQWQHMLPLSGFLHGRQRNDNMVSVAHWVGLTAISVAWTRLAKLHGFQKFDDLTSSSWKVSDHRREAFRTHDGKLTGLLCKVSFPPAEKPDGHRPKDWLESELPSADGLSTSRPCVFANYGTRTFIHAEHLLEFRRTPGWPEWPYRNFNVQGRKKEKRKFVSYLKNIVYIDT